MQHQEQMKAARGMVEQSSVNVEVQSTRVPFVQRRFSPKTQTVKRLCQPVGSERFHHGIQKLHPIWV